MILSIATSSSSPFITLAVFLEMASWIREMHIDSTANPVKHGWQKIYVSLCYHLHEHSHFTDGAVGNSQNHLELVQKGCVGEDPVLEADMGGQITKSNGCQRDEGEVGGRDKVPALPGAEHLERNKALIRFSSNVKSLKSWWVCFPSLGQNNDPLNYWSNGCYITARKLEVGYFWH